MRTDPHPLPEPRTTPAEATDPTSPAEIALARLRVALPAAAAAAIEAGVELETWMQAAWAAYVEQRPGLRAELEEQQLRGQLDELRKQGRLARA